MHHHHRDRKQPGHHRKGREQAEQRAFVETAQVAIQPKRRALQHVAHSHAEHQRGHEAADEQRPVPAIAPAGIGALGAVLERHGAQDQGRQHQEHGEVEAGKADRIDEWPGRKDRPAAQDEPHLVAFPVRCDGVDRHAAFLVRLADEGHQRGNAQVIAISQGKADQQRAHQAPPDDPQRFVVERDFHVVFLPYSAGSGA